LRRRSWPIRLCAIIPSRLRRGIGRRTEISRFEIRRVEVIFSGNPDQREKGIPSRVGEGCSHALRRGGIKGFASK
jgi:hypothetical protein